MKKISEAVLFKVVIPAAVLLFKITALTFRFSEINAHKISPFNGKEKNYIYGFFHSQLLSHIYYYRNTKMGSLASTHKDGEIAARVAEKFGIKMTRGSSTRGGAGAIRGLKRMLDSGYDIALTVDGPRGPSGSVNNGVIYLAKLTGKEIVPACFNCTSKIRLRSWDRFMIPFPFSKGYFNFGKPIKVPRGAEGGEIEVYKEKVRKELVRINGECAAALGLKDGGI